MTSRKRPPSTYQPISLSATADYLRVPTRWVRERIDSGELAVVVADGLPMLNLEQVQALANSEAYWSHKDDENTRSFETPYIPERLREYHRFHQTINDFTWLLKAAYTPREQLKKRIFRLDHLLQYYLAEVAPAEKIIKSLASAGELTSERAKTASESLKKVWFNELAYTTPPLEAPLLLDRRGVAANLEASADRLAFPSWRITQAYYVSYHASRALADLCALSYRPVEHHAPMRAFKNGALAPLSRSVIIFPFNISAKPHRSSFKELNFESRHPHLKFGYASHPRPPNLSFTETGQAVLDALHASRQTGWSRRSSGEPFLITDFLYQFRVWANYVDVENIVALKSSGFRTYLDLDLHTITFFLASIVELIALARIGPERMILIAEEFHNDFVKGDRRLWHSTALHPLNVRLQIYEHTGRLCGLRWRPALPPPAAAVELL